MVKQWPLFGLTLMTDVFSIKKRSQVMAAIKSKGNKDTELRLMAMFKAHGIAGWRRNQKLIGKPDFVFRRERLAIFVDGCFWHGCPKHGHNPKSNNKYWAPKLARNQSRDKKVCGELKKNGWHVLRLWEHELGQTDRTIKRIKAGLQKRQRLAEKLIG